MPSPLDDAIQKTDIQLGLTGQAVAQTDPALGNRVTQWSNVAGSLSPDLSLSLAQSGIAPGDPVGQWIIKSGLPALQNSSASSVRNVLSDPTLLAQLGRLPSAQQTNLFKRGVGDIAALDATHLQRLVTTGDPNVHHSFLNKLGDIATTGARDVFTGLQAGAETTAAAYRDMTAMANRNPGPDPLGMTEKIQTPGYGTLADTANQVTAYQAIAHDKSLGQGFFPAGPAHAAAVSAQQQAASVDGHALTPGRALAVTMLEPGSRPFQIASGTVDFANAYYADPANVALGETADMLKASRVFGATPEATTQAVVTHLLDTAGSSEKMTALADFAGPGDLATNLADKIRANPGSVAQLVDRGVTTMDDINHAIGEASIGGVRGLFRNLVDKPNAMTWIASDKGQKTLQQIADRSALDVWLGSNKKIPADVAWQLGPARTPGEVADILGSALGAKGSNVPDTLLPYGWKRPFQNLRWAHLMPTGTMDFTDINDAVEQAHREMVGLKMPSWQINNTLRDIALAPNEGAFGQAIEKMSNVEATHLAANYGVSPSIAAQFTTRFRNNWSEDQKFFRDAVGDVPHVPGVALGDDALPLQGPHLAAELSNSWPTLNGRTIRNLTSRFAALDDVAALGTTKKATVATMDGLTDLQKIGALARLGLPVRVVSEAQARIAAAGGIGIFNHPIDAAALTLGGADYKMPEGLAAKIAHPLSSAAAVAANLAGRFIDPMAAHAIPTTLDAPEGELFRDMLHDQGSTFLKAVGQTSLANPTIFSDQQVLAKGYDWIPKYLEPLVNGEKALNPQFADAWAQELAQLSADPAGREVARALLDPAHTPAGVENTGNSLDNVTKWYTDGAGQAERMRLADAHLSWGSARLADDPAFIKGYVGDLANLPDWSLLKRVLTKTGATFDAEGRLVGAPDPELLHAISNGTPFDWGRQTVKPSFVRSLADKAPDAALDGVKGRKILYGAKGGILDRATDKLFSMLMDRPYSELAKSPDYRQFHWQEANRLLPFLDADSQKVLVDAAGREGFKGWQIPATATGQITLKDASDLAHVKALNQTKGLLHYVSERNNLFDSLRIVFPFGDAWRNAIGKWSRLVAENPRVIRRVQQGVTEARNSGFFFLDPADGTEKFSLVPPAVVKWGTGVPWALASPVKGLSLASQGLPGAGAVVTWGAAAVMQHVPANPVTEDLANLLMPYGSPDFSGGTFESLFPGWLNKLRASGYLAPIFDASPTQKRVIIDLAHHIAAYNISTGNYDTSTQQGLTDLQNASMDEAKKMTLWRGFAQMGAPSAPDYIPQAMTRSAATTKGGVPPATLRAQGLKDGQLIEPYMLAQDYHKMITAEGGDTYKATIDFISKWGRNLLFETQRDSRQLAFNIPTTAEAEIWQAQHPAIASNFKDVFGYWVPQNGQFSYLAYTDAIARGQIATPDVHTWAELAQARLGNALYARYRQTMPASPTQDERNQLDAYKAAVQQAYPGFKEWDALKQSRLTTDGIADEIKGAASSTALRNTDLSKAALEYINYRDQAKAAAVARSGNAGAGIGFQAMADWQTYLYQLGTALATRYPDFRTMWQDVFQNEVNPTSGP